MASSRKKTRKPTKSEREKHLRLREFIRSKAHAYLQDPNVNTVGVGHKISNGRDTGVLCLQFTVGQKIEADVAIEALGSKSLPESIEVGGEMVPTDIIERSYKPSFRVVAPQTLNDRKQRRTPMVPGISIGHGNISAGTLGLFVYDNATGQKLILSNWHVLNGGNGKPGDAIFQPGRHDDSNTGPNLCGRLVRSHVGAAGDCAVVRIEGRDIDTAIEDLGVTPDQAVEVDLGDVVVKSGRTTGVTYGVVRRVDVMARLNYDVVGKQIIGGFEIGPWRDGPDPDGEVSMGGDSGAAWVIADGTDATRLFAGLHFAGEGSGNPDEYALACYPRSVLTKLGAALQPPQVAAQADDLGGTQPRTGYDVEFLGLAVPMPVLTTALKRDAINFSRYKNVFPYTHFSVCQSKKYRMARFVAWNIDGAKRVSLPRTGFRLDPRIDADLQLGEDLYSSNPLDRGHIARRADLNWGTIEEARQANRDSFYFTNIAPQHRLFNQSNKGGIWGRLENTILEQAETQDIKISVLAGPVFKLDDPEYRGARIPRSFWKIICYAGTDGQLRAVPFLLTQRDFLIGLEDLDFDPFALFQVPVARVEAETGLDLAHLHCADVLAHPELATQIPLTEAATEAAQNAVEIHRVADLVI